MDLLDFTQGKDDDTPSVRSKERLREPKLWFPRTVRDLGLDEATEDAMREVERSLPPSMTTYSVEPDDQDR